MRPKQYALVSGARKTVPLDTHIAPAEVQIQTVITGTGDFSLVTSYTLDNPLTTAESSLNWVTLFTAAATTAASVKHPMAAISFLYAGTSGASTCAVNLIQSGPHFNA